jgi:hypothetical protein
MTFPPLKQLRNYATREKWMRRIVHQQQQQQQQQQQ